MKRGRKKWFAPVLAVSMFLTACGTMSSQQEPTVVGREVSAEAGDTTEQTEPVETQAETQAEETASKNDNIITSREELTFPLGQEIPSDSFIGTAYIASMITPDDTYHFPATNHVTFEPGSRSSWHTHGGMVILVTGGTGYYQEEGQPAQIIQKGDVIEIPEGVRHWHGATPDSWFSQMVIFDSGYVPEEEESAAEEPVSDEYYQQLETEEYAGRTVTDENEFMFQRAAEAINLDTFNGPVYLSTLLDEENAAGAPELHYVVFEKGVINNWHTHEGGQILIATDGIGYHQMENGEVEVLYPGDVAFCPPGVMHWHGGSANTEFAHIAVNTNPEMTGLEWFDRISEEEYGLLGTEKTSH